MCIELPAEKRLERELRFLQRRLEPNQRLRFRAHRFDVGRPGRLDCAAARRNQSRYEVVDHPAHRLAAETLRLDLWVALLDPAHVLREVRQAFELLERDEART